MDRWQNRIAVVTGAGSGIGAACVRDLLKAGMIVVGLARRENRINDLRKNLPECVRENLHAVKCDITKEEDVVSAFNCIEGNIGGVDVLVNNAAICVQTPLVAENNYADIRSVIDTNVLGTILATREAFRSMKCRNVNGHIILINSIVGHIVPYFSAEAYFNVYPATKFAITALTESYRQEFLKEKTKVKITSISPGAVCTKFLSEDIRKGPLMKGQSFLFPEDVSNAILYCLQTPPHVQIQQITVKPIGEKF